MRHAGVSQGLTLVTGATGSGKTALVVDWLRQVRGRRVLVQGIPDLQVEHEPAPPLAEWCEVRVSEEDAALRLPYFRLPAGCLLVVDEAQRVYPGRSVGSRVPDHVAALSTRRHVGVDVILVTQHPGLIDSAVRKLVNRHYHVHSTPYGARLLFWEGACGSPDDASSRKIAERVRYKPSPAVFGLYKSAELHTERVKRVPRAAILAGVLVLGCLAGAGYIWHRLDARLDESNAKVESAPQGGSAPGQPEGVRARSSGGYVADRVPEVAGLVHTAPAYSELVKPVSVPYPAGCIQSARVCRCYDQRGGIYPAAVELCRQWVVSPFFREWVSDDVGQVQPSVYRQEVRSVGGPQSAIVDVTAGAGISEVGQRGATTAAMPAASPASGLLAGRSAAVGAGGVGAH
ncbi:zonular occludens toxin domain-containing protein [Accumulibacter sp.]|uniref:zonular occludens toxin domain-containing protein n=1 Tax=Accumulibacter sp. TaxID=2053492 RepID=UPI001ACBD302|nr:zonular occludens toxin domain-containing protein [Accumulibacter sp.]MBN8454824.1 hypothetical protein [Accumulibacter sp.]